MARHSLGAWSLTGLVAAALGWTLGGLFGSLLARTLLAGAFTAAGFGLLSRRALLGGVAALAAALAGGAAWLLGQRLSFALLAWPAIALVVAAAAAFVLARPRARAAAILVAPLCAGLGSLAGAILVALAGFALNDGRVVGALLGGGAAGFGCGMLAGLRLVARWFEPRGMGQEGGA